MKDMLSEKISGKNAHETGQFEGKFLIAMPNLDCGVFSRSIIFICAHSAEGAMGFQVNKSGQMTLSELIKSSELGAKGSIKIDKSRLDPARIRDGGPVDDHRGFVLHSADYDSDSTIPISESVYLTSNLQILRSIAEGVGPERKAIALGYAGWGPGQLEEEFAENSWLCVEADPEIVFEPANDGKYERALAQIGIKDANFVTEAGHA